MLTPQEVKDKTFGKVMMGGYAPAMVDEFLDELTKDYTSLYQDNAALKSKLKVLAKTVEEYRTTQDDMRIAFYDAKKKSETIVTEATRRAESIVAVAEQEASEEIARIRASVEKERLQLDAARKETADFIAQWRSICVRQESFLETLPELPLPAGGTAQTVPAPEASANPTKRISKEEVQEVLAQAGETRLFPPRSAEPEPSMKEETPEAPAPAAPVPDPFEASAAFAADTQDSDDWQDVFANAPSATEPERKPEDKPASLYDSNIRLFNPDDLKFGKNYNTRHDE